ncbi:glycogen-binding subunit 76A-like, partial [Limulus polyphemus]|uniref:Glycogen-binding subunit 76A-like n=1 Tax=Limulus polyphemus TaxID=6850 RepID=A0ABM1TLT6_LIMPO
SPDSCGLWLGGSHSPPSSPASPVERVNLQNSDYKSPERRSSILRKKKRADSFPAPQKREGRKVVRFADALGLDLESVRYMVKSDLPPSIPQSAFSDLRRPQLSLSSPYDIELVPNFTMPSLSSDFENRVREQTVSLHSVSTADTTVYGIVALMNLTFHKNVFIRYTVNNWNSHHDVNASYIQGSTDGEIDKFAFNIFANPQDLSSQSHSLDFAICYETQDGREFWDNNNNLNYSLKSKAKHQSFVSTNNHSWVHFL